MKKGLFYALCLGALAMSASCQKTEQNPTEKGNSVVFTAQCDVTKTVLNAVEHNLFGIETKSAFSMEKTRKALLRFTRQRQKMPRARLLR